MNGEPGTTAPPRDYRLLVPRDWFRIDLVQDRWRAQLKTFVDHQAKGRNVPAETMREVWTTLRNTAEAGVRNGALEFFLRPELDDGTILPATLIVSLIPRPGALAPPALRDTLEAREARSGRDAEVSVMVLPAGETVRVLTPTTMDLYVQMPGGVGYLVMAFAVPLSDVTGPMHRLCASMAESLRWIR
ncbi:hypothetical protein ACIO13_28455 [Streptomyces sp. NPDC087425]|uniref:hypothetical protein n=1 Tax=Streptomyces sp. NPDC087425 TaxID=3365787 RepID=UPI0037F5A3E3